MHFVDHPENNITLVAPKGEEQHIVPVRAYKRRHPSLACDVTTVTLELDAVDKLKVMNGGKLRISVLGRGFAPMYAEVE